MSLALIAVAAANNVIGRNNQLPWHLPGELSYFKATTMAKPVIMGRKTFESIGHPLSGRDNIVVSRNASYKAVGVKVVNNLKAAIALAQNSSPSSGEIMVIGGAQLYAQALPMAERIYLTRVHSQFAGDAWFPELEQDQWHEVSRQDIAATAANPFAFSYLVLDRISP